MTASDIVERVRISDVAEVLGVKLDRTRRRAVATWREEARHFSVALCDAKGTWFDHARGEGGGLIDFVARVRGYDRKTALEWLAAYAGVPLDHQTESERREWARRMRVAEPEAKKLVAWKLETLESLRAQRNRLMRIYHNAVRFLINHNAGECIRRGDVRYQAALAIRRTYWPRVEELDGQVDALEAAGYPDLLRQWGFA